MKSLAFVAFGALAACASSGDDYPVVPGGGGAPGGSTTTTSSVISGRVCLVTDPRFLSRCATTGAAGLQVSIGNGTATTNANGEFVMNTPTVGNTTTISVTGAGIVPSTTPLNASVQIPVLNQALFNQMVLATGITPSAGSGSIIATVTRAGEPVAGVTAVATPSPAFGPFFDGTTPTSFTLDPTGAQGVVFFSGARVNTPTNLTFTDPSTLGETTVGGVQVVDGGITFVEGVLP